MPDVLLYPGEAIENDVRLANPTVLRFATLYGTTFLTGLGSLVIFDPAYVSFIEDPDRGARVFRPGSVAARGFVSSAGGGGLRGSSGSAGLVGSRGSTGTAGG